MLSFFSVGCSKSMLPLFVWNFFEGFQEIWGASGKRRKPKTDSEEVCNKNRQDSGYVLNDSDNKSFPEINDIHFNEFVMVVRCSLSENESHRWWKVIRPGLTWPVHFWPLWPSNFWAPFYIITYYIVVVLRSYCAGTLYSSSNEIMVLLNGWYPRQMLGYIKLVSYKDVS